jgi:malate dehydrogenase (oxaloacetate-decarboxylating)
VNNSLGFPGILKGALVVRAKKITDEMAIAAAYSMANFAQKNGITPERIMPTMDETEVYAQEAADVAMEAIKNGVARITFTWQEVFDKTMAGIKEARDAMGLLMEKNFIKKPDIKLLEDAVKKAIEAVK